jgi:hypothetical protein
MRNLLRWLFFPFGVALLALMPLQEGTFFPSRLQEQTPAPTFDSERLAEPTIPADPSQADVGARDYWLYCLACHGDQGQGLSDEFRLLYPPEEQTCWQSGCHGRSPYENGFTLPTAIPPVIGADAPLHNFADASVLYAFISAAMPWHDPGSLEPEIYWRLTAYLLRENGYENPYEELGPENSGFIPLRGDLESTEIAQVTAHPTLGVENKLTEPAIGHMVESSGSVIVAIFVIAALLIVGIFVLIRRRSARPRS